MHKNLLLISVFACLAVSINGQIRNSGNLIIREILIEGNYVTNKKIIFRELDFKINETVRREEVEFKRLTSVNNLTKTSLFNFVEINVNESEDNNLTIIVKVTERWYIWPYIFLNQADRNFSEWWRTKDLDKLEYGVGLKINNFRGLGESILLNYHMGNFIKYELDYRGIYLDKSKRHALSFLATYSAQNILPWNIEKNKEVILKDNRKIFKSTKFELKYAYRKGYFSKHQVELGYTDFNIADTVYLLNPYYAGLNKHRQRYFNLKYEYSWDTRDSKIYPKTGSFIVAGINKRGLGIYSDEYNSVDMYTQIYLYWKLYKHFYIASGIWGTTNMTNSYVFSAEPGLGYLQFVRGYEYYAVHGNNAMLFKSLFKYELLPMKVINLNIWPIRKLHQFNKVPVEVYVNVFFDAGYVSGKFDSYKAYNNTLVNKMMYSTGAGIDFITYYDKVLSIDYSFNALGDRGFFIHWKAAIR
jgi:outer membrane protein assembly factor BamA